MSGFFLLLILSVFVLSAACLPSSDGPPDLKAVPKTEAIDVKELVQGVQITDPYRWLEDQDSPATRSWIERQNAYTDTLLSRLPAQEKLKKQLNELMRVDTVSIPFLANGRYFYMRRRADQDLQVLYMRQGLQGDDQVLIDPHPLSSDHTVSISLSAIVHDGSLLVYSVREGGQDEVVPKLFDVETRQPLPDSFLKARYDCITILNDKSGLYFGKLTADGPRIFFHKIGSDPSTDQEVFGKGLGADKGLACDISEDGRYLTLVVFYGSNGKKTDVYVKDLTSPANPIVPIVHDVAAAFYPDIAADKMYMRTNWNAPKWRVLEVDLKNPAQERWRELIPQSGAVMDGFSVVGGKLAARLTENVISRVKIFDLNGRMVREITGPAIGSLSDVTGPGQGHEGFYTFSSFDAPRTIYRYDMETGKQSVWWRSQSPIETSKYEVKQVWYSSKDGTRVPMFLAYQKGLKLDGSNPILLTGYGGFNVSSYPDYSPFAAAWMENSGVYGVANLRGGGEFGEAWHEAGMLEKKQNVFDDFIAAAEWLIHNKYTSPQKLAIMGVSNGGLLVGAALTQRPDLFGAVICEYPLLDMLRYQKFLVAKYWVSEYGSSDDPAQFKYLLQYSPYHHVRPGAKYPAVLLVTGDADTRVAPLHARKMTALLQADNGSDKPVMLRYEVKAGHAGGLPVSVVVNNDAEQLAFLMWQLGMK